MSDLCEEPGDISLLTLKILQKCCGGDEVTFVLYVCRGTLGYALTMAEAFILAFNVFELSDMEAGPSVGVVFAIIIPMLAGLLFLGWMAGKTFQVEGEEFKLRRSKYVLAYKTINVIFSIAIAAGTIYGWDLIDIENLFKDADPAKIFLIVSLGLDLLFDPIEMVIGYCIFCKN